MGPPSQFLTTFPFGISTQAPALGLRLHQPAPQSTITRRAPDRTNSTTVVAGPMAHGPETTIVPRTLLPRAARLPALLSAEHKSCSIPRIIVAPALWA